MNSGNSGADPRKMASGSAALAVVVQLSLVAALAILVFYLFGYSRLEFNSDDATNSLAAQAMFDQGTLLPRTWMVANGDLMVPSSAMLMAPLLFWLPNGFVVHAIAVTVLALVLLFAVTAFLRAAKLPFVPVAVVVMTLALGFSRTFLAMTYVETAYVWWPMAFFAMAALIVLHDRGFLQESHSDRWLLAGLFVVTFLISVKNPTRVAVMVVLPAFVFNWALSSARMVSGQVRSPGIRGLSPALARAGSMLAALATAFVFVQVLLRTGVVVDYAAASAIQIADLDGIKAHWLLFVNGWFQYLGAETEKYAYEPWEPVMRTWRSLVVCALTFVIVLELRDFRRNEEPIRRAMIFSFFAAFLPILAIYLLFDPLAQDYITTRYFTLSYLVLLALATWRIRDALAANRRFCAVLLMGFCLLSLLSGVQRMIPLSEAQANNASSPMILVATLRENGLRHGYGSWWNAGATTIMSDSQIRVDPILFLPSSIVAYPYMVDSRWYDSSKSEPGNFLVFTADELEPGQRDTVRGKFGPEQREIVAGDARILVYDHDISSKFLCRQSVRNDVPLADDAFAKVEILSAEAVPASRPGGRLGVAVRIRNGTDAAITSTGRYPITVGIHLLDSEGKMLSFDFVHENLGCALQPQQERTIRITLPELSRGEYRLEVDRIQEGYAWFGVKGAETRKVDLSVP